MQATRRRITEAAMELHGTLGPARTTMTAAAEHAGVQRQTVYRHFANEDELLASCSAHFAARHPWPDARRRAMLLAAARHAVDFYTWGSLAGDGGVSRTDVVELTSAMLRRAAGTPSGSVGRSA